jgi:hypothetical protein
MRRRKGDEGKKKGAYARDDRCRPGGLGRVGKDNSFEIGRFVSTLV